MGEPCECEQEAANSVVTAGCMNGTVERAEPMVADADVDRMALLGREPAERASGVDEGNGMEHEPQTRLPKTELYCKETGQCNENANKTVPIAHGLPLEGEWTMYASGKVSDPVDGVEPEGCEGGTDESTELLMMSVEPYVEDSGDILRVHLRGMRMRPGNANGPGSQTDGPRGQSDMSKGQADHLRGWMDTLSMSNSAEMAVISHGDGMNTYLGAGDVKHAIDATDGVETHVDASTRQGEVPSVESDASSIETDTRTAVNVRRDVRKRQAEAQTQNSPKGPQIEPPKSTRRWKRIGVGDISMYLPWNVPVEALGQTFEFGQVEGRDEVIAPSVEGETARD